MKIIAERGYIIPAFNSADRDYVACAEQLKSSICEWHADANITILTIDDLPYGDHGGQANDWQMFYASPYRQTIKLEADMWCASPIDHWWTLFESHDVVISQGARDYYDKLSNTRHYRQLFDRNRLADVYNAITYWRLSNTAKEFFDLVRLIFENWEDYKTLLIMPDDEPTTDVVYAIAAQIMGPEKLTLPTGIGPNIVHMKKHICRLRGEDWTKELIWERTYPGLRINTVAQYGLVHYHTKDWRA